MGLLNGNPLDLLGGGGGTTNASSGGIGNSDSANDARAYDASSGAGDYGTNNANTTIITGGTNTMGDYGAINGALKLALAGVESAHQLAADISHSNADLLAGSLSNSAKQNEQFSSALENVKTADVRVLIFGVGAMVLIVGLAVFARKKS